MEERVKIRKRYQGGRPQSDPGSSYILNESQRPSDFRNQLQQQQRLVEAKNIPQEECTSRLFYSQPAVALF